MEVTLSRLRVTTVGLACAALAALAGFAFGIRTGEGAREYPPGVLERMLTPPPVPIADSLVARADSIVRRFVEQGAFPGAALAVGNRDLVQVVRGYGRTRWNPRGPTVDPDSTLYDLASLTKVVSTTAAVMALVEDGRLRLDAPVRAYLPAFTGGGKERVTVRHLLTHTGGLRAGARDFDPDASRARVLRFIFDRPLALEPGKDVLYSDLGFVLLWMVAERAAGEPLQGYLAKRVWGPLGMRSTVMGVPKGCSRCAPTLFLDDSGEPYAGGSYDEVGRRLDGVSGNAGAFSTASDLARFAAMIANEGRYGNVRIYEKRTVRLFTRAQPGAGTRALGWEVYCREGIVPDHARCREVLGFGHTGVTGTSLWIDPASRTWVVLLANRTYLPRWDVDMQPLRRRVFRAVTGITPPK